VTTSDDALRGRSDAALGHAELFNDFEAEAVQHFAIATGAKILNANSQMKPSCRQIVELADVKGLDFDLSGFDGVELTTPVRSR